MKAKNEMIRTLFVIAMLGLGGCSGDGGNTTGTELPDPPDPPAEPPPAMASVPVGMPALFIETSEDASVFNDIIGDFIEGSRQNFVQFVPETGEAALITTNLSRSFAQSISFIRSFDDELYLLNIFDTGARIKKFDTDALLEAQPDIPVPTPLQFDSMNERCFAVFGDDLYYKVAWREAPFPATGFADGPLVRVDGFFSDPSGTVVTELIPGIGGDSPSSGGFVTDACFSNMDTDSGIWYDYEKEEIQGSSSTTITFTTYTRDVSTGEPTAKPGELILGVANELRDQVSLSNIAFDRGEGYLAILDESAQEFGILQFNPDISPVNAELVHSELLTGVNATGVRTLDADDGYISFVITTPTFGEDLVALFDLESSTVEFFDFGVAINQLEVIFREN